MQERQYKIIDNRRLDIALIQAAVSEAWADMHVRGSASYASAQEHGLNISVLPRNLKQVLQVRPAGAGIGSVDMVVAGFLGKAAWDMWRYVVMPYIEGRWGVGVIREKLAAEKRVAAIRGKKAAKKKSAVAKRATARGATGRATATNRTVAKKRGRQR
jgi:hypothetical protein